MQNAKVLSSTMAPATSYSSVMPIQPSPERTWPFRDQSIMGKHGHHIDRYGKDLRRIHNWSLWTRTRLDCCLNAARTTLTKRFRLRPFLRGRFLHRLDYLYHSHHHHHCPHHCDHRHRRRLHRPPSTYTLTLLDPYTIGLMVKCECAAIDCTLNKYYTI